MASGQEKLRERAALFNILDRPQIFIRRHLQPVNQMVEFVELRALSVSDKIFSIF